MVLLSFDDGRLNLPASSVWVGPIHDPRTYTGPVFLNTSHKEP